MKINTNMAAQQILNNLNKADNKAAAVMERLSSGLRINKAADDAAGLAIANKLDTQVRGLKQANRNAMDGISMIQTAEGALNEISDMLQRIRELTVQAGNGTYTEEDKKSIEVEIDELMQEMTAIQKNTEFNKIPVLSGSQNKITLQTGANSGQNLVVDGNYMDMNQMLVGINGITADRIEGAVEEKLEIEPENKAEGLDAVEGVTSLGPGEITADQINKLTGPVNIASGTIITGDVEVKGNIKFGDNVTINGKLKVEDGDVCIGKNFNIGINNIVVANGNLKLEALPIVAEIKVNGAVEVAGSGTIENLSGTITNLTLKDSIKLELLEATVIQGNLTLQGASEVTAQDKLSVFGELNVLGTASISTQAALEVSEEVNLQDAGTIEVKGNLSISDDLNTSGIGKLIAHQNLYVAGDVNSVSSSAITVEEEIQIDGDASLSSDLISTSASITINGTAQSTAQMIAGGGNVNVLQIPKPVTPPVITGEGKEMIINGERIQLTAEEIANGVDIQAGSVLSITLPEDITVKVDGEEVAIPAGQQVIIQVGENNTRLENGKIALSSGDVLRFPGVTELQDKNSSTLDFSDTEGVNKALENVDRAVTSNSTMRSRLGAYQNRLEHTVSNLGSSEENMTASLSRIQDADMAEEMATYTQTNILTQAATAMLAQANQRPQQVLQLLN